MIEKTDVQKKQKNQDKQKMEWHLHKGEACNLAWAMTYLNLELQKDVYTKNTIPESE